MSRKLVIGIITTVLALGSVSWADTVIGNWEDGVDAWEVVDDAPAGTTAETSMIGATVGDQSLKLVVPQGGFNRSIRLDINAQGLTQAFQNSTSLSVDVTRLVEDWTGDPNDGQTGLHFLINAGGDGWSIWEQGDYVGWWAYTEGDQTQTVVWDYSQILPQIQFDNLWWLELWVFTNYDAEYTSGGVYYLDNAVLFGTVDNSKSTDVIIGNWEQEMDGWVPGDAADLDLLYSDSNGVTLDDYSLDLWHTEPGWQQVLKLNLIENELLDAFSTNQQVSVDVTRLVENWPTDSMPNWGGLHMAVSIGGSDWSVWQEFGFQGGWVPSNGDQTTTVAWSYANHLSRMDFNDVTYAELLLHTNYDPDFSGPVWIYLDSARLFGGGRALDPQPADTAEDVRVDTTLTWKAPDSAAMHHLYFGTDRAKVAAASMDSDPDVTFAVLDVNSFDPNMLDFSTTYYWRVDEVNEVSEDSPWRGPIWSFTTGNFIVVDDFESYTDDLDTGAVFLTWIDGFNDETNGSQVGNLDPPFMERTIVHGGTQSMPFTYNNADVVRSEATRMWVEAQDWTAHGFSTLKLYVYGLANNGVDPLYVTVEDAAGISATVAYGDPTVLQTEEWTEWTIPLAEFVDVDMTAVTRMVIGVGSAGAPSGAIGTVYIDDIRIAPQPVGLVAYYAFENNLEDNSGNEHHGLLVGDPNYPLTYVDGPAGFGTAVQFDGEFGHEIVELGTFNPSAATGNLSVAMWTRWNGLTDAWQGLIGKRHAEWDANGMLWQIEVHQTSGALRLQREGTGDVPILPDGLPSGEWTHIAITFDGTTGKGYVDGENVSESGFSFGFDREAPLVIGSSTVTGGNPYNGAIDEVRIYDTVLTEAEIAELAGK